NKSKLLRSLNQPIQPQPNDTLPRTDTASKKVNKQKTNDGQLTGAARTFGQLLTSIKRVGITYSEGATTFLPGCTDGTSFLGQNWQTGQPGLDFVFGKQPDSNWLKEAAQKGLITKDPFLNNLFRQTYDQRLSLTAQIEPVRDLSIDLNMDKTLYKTYTSLFKDTTGLGSFKELNPYSGGGFSISYISFQTLFKKFNANEISETFKNFENNRLILSQRLAAKNPYSNPNPGPDGY